MVDSGFWVPEEKLGRVAEPFATDPVTRQPIVLPDVSQPPGNDLGGSRGVSTAIDYARFCQMLLDGGRLGAERVLSRTTVNLMTTDHLGSAIATPVTPGEIVQGTVGYTFGLGFMVRREPGLPGVAGSVGEFLWSGHTGPYFWIDPAEQLVAVYMSQTPGPSRVPSRQVLKQLVTQAIDD